MEALSSGWIIETENVCIERGFRWGCYIWHMGRSKLREREWHAQSEKSGRQRLTALSSNSLHLSLLSPVPPKSHFVSVRDPPSVWQKLWTHRMLFAFLPGHILQPTLQLPCAVTEFWPMDVRQEWYTPIPGLVPKDSLCDLPYTPAFPSVWLEGLQSPRKWEGHWEEGDWVPGWLHHPALDFDMSGSGVLCHWDSGVVCYSS